MPIGELSQVSYKDVISLSKQSNIIYTRLINDHWSQFHDILDPDVGLFYKNLKNKISTLKSGLFTNMKYMSINGVMKFNRG